MSDDLVTPTKLGKRKLFGADEEEDNDVTQPQQSQEYGPGSPYYTPTSPPGPQEEDDTAEVENPTSTSTCLGCQPNQFQENQGAHTDIGGCLYQPSDDDVSNMSESDDDSESDSSVVFVSVKKAPIPASITCAPILPPRSSDAAPLKYVRKTPIKRESATTSSASVTTTAGPSYKKQVQIMYRELKPKRTKTQKHCSFCGEAWYTYFDLPCKHRACVPCFEGRDFICNECKD